ncbi:MAG: DUF4421 family protein [Cyclobacteriaceae bacterium]
MLHAQQEGGNIVTYKDKFFIWPVIKQRALSFDIRPANQQSPLLQYKPNRPVSMGVGVYAFDVSFELAFAVPLAASQEELYGNTTSRDLQINLISRRFGADAMYQRYQGFYLSDSRIKIPGGQPFPQRADVRTSLQSVSGFYVFNHKRFSLRSAYTFADRQLTSAGSFLLAGTLSDFQLNADSAVVSQDQQQSIGLSRRFTELGYQTLSIAPGFSYNLVYRKFLFNVTASFGPANHWTHYRDLSGSEHYDIAVNSFADIRLALGYNSDHLFGGITYGGQSRRAKMNEMQFANVSTSVRVVIGYRFREFGVLKHSVWELVPILLKTAPPAATK